MRDANETKDLQPGIAAPDAARISPALLEWYDVHARTMPWRVGPAERAAGVRPDPYGVWLSEVMLQQTTVAAVRDYWQRFMARWPGVADLAAAEDAEVMAEWAGLGYYARARNLLKCARAVVADHGGVFPDSRDGLIALPGVGPYTAAAVAAIAHDEAATVVDGNVERVVARLFAVIQPMPAAKPRLHALAATLTPGARAGDHAQAMMDLGATICTPRSPACGICPLVDPCEGRRQGIAAELPRKAAKAPKPRRRGIAYVVTDAAGAVLLETRPDSGLLGGMPGFPGSDWIAEGDPLPAPPIATDWQEAGHIQHTFTHFHLDLRVLRAEVPEGRNPARGRFIPGAEFRAGALPTVMRKVWTRATAG